MTDPKANNVWVEQLGSTLRHGGDALDSVPHILKTLLETEAWRCFQPRMGPEVTHERFVDFITTPPLAGLGTNVDLVRRVISGDIEAVDRLDQALKNPTGHPISSVNIIDERPRGTSKDYALRRLRKDAPELHADVLAGKLSAHAAMVQGGFRPRTFTVLVTSKPDRIAATLRRELDPQTLADVAELLRKED
jgi:hypothetical protein